MRKKIDLKIDTSILVWIIIVIIFFAGSIVVVWKLGLFTLSPSDTGAKIIASVLALIGILFTSVISLIGLFLKHTFDIRNLRLQEESSERLKMDTAIQAVSLMSTSSGNESAYSQQVGALFALVSLNQIELALALLDQKWSKNSIDSNSAVWIIDKSLESPLAQNQIDASEILLKNTSSLWENETINWPACMCLDWNISLHVYARANLFYSLIETILIKPKEVWKKNRLNGAIIIIYKAMITETDYLIKVGAILILETLINYTIDGLESKGGLMVESNYIEIETILENIRTLKKDFEIEDNFQDIIDSELFELILKVKQWTA